MSTIPKTFDDLIVEEITILYLPTYQVDIVSEEELTLDEIKAYDAFIARYKK